MYCTICANITGTGIFLASIFSSSAHFLHFSTSVFAYGSRSYGPKNLLGLTCLVGSTGTHSIITDVFVDQAMVHCGSIRQTASIIRMSSECLRTGDKALVLFRWAANFWAFQIFQVGLQILSEMYRYRYWFACSECQLFFYLFTAECQLSYCGMPRA
jgi:hypothetical protein